MAKLTDTLVDQYVELVRDGALEWQAAALELREMFGLSVLELHEHGWTERLQAADSGFRERLARARLSRVAAASYNR